MYQHQNQMLSRLIKKHCDFNEQTNKHQISQSIDKTRGLSINHQSVSPSINQSINQSVSQSVSQGGEGKGRKRVGKGKYEEKGGEGKESLATQATPS